MSDFVADDRRQFIVRQIQLADDAGINRDFSARHAVSVHFVAVQDIDFPVPFQGVRPKYADLRDKTF